MNNHTFIIKLIFAFSFSLFFSSSLFAEWRDFSLRYNQILKGELVSVGNAFVVNPDPYNSTTCDTYTDGPFTDPVTTNNSQQYYCQYNVDGDQGKAATRAELQIPTGGKIVWAGLYWQALTPHKESYDNFSIEIRNDNDNTGYHTQTATHIDYQSKYTDHIYPVGSSSGAKYADLYSAFADVTQLFQSNNWQDGNYTVRTPDVMEGRETWFGVYGAWNLVVIYQDSNASYKSFSIFDGWKEVSSSSSDVPVTVTGFYTPDRDEIKSNITFFAAEGDYNINGDKLKAIRQSDNATVEFLNDNNPNLTNQTFSSYVHTTGTRLPDEKNNNGIDIQSVAIGTDTTYNLLESGQTDLEFQFTSTGDLYFPSVLAFATEVYAPRICYDYTYGQNDYFQTPPSIKPTLVEGTFNDDPINVKLYFKNLENSDITISNLTVNINPIDSNTLYRANTTYVTKPGSSLQEFISDENRDTAFNKDNNISIGTVGSLEYFYTNYSLDHTSNELNASINLFLNFDLTVTINGEDVNLGKNNISIADMDPCTSSSAYQPVPGRFNIVHSSQINSSLSSGYYYNLPTQVVNRYDDNFVAESMDPNNLDTTKPIATMAALEMVDMSGFRYTSATCTDNNASTISNSRIWVLFDDSDTATVAGSALQNAQFFKRASKNAAFRLAYNVVDDNGSVLLLEKENNGDYTILNWQTRWNGDDCTQDMVTNGNGNDNKIASYCNATGNNPNTLATCMECIYGYDTKRMCSRDNFAIRPAGFIFSLKDSNQTNTTIISSIPSTSDYSLAAGYQYIFETDATSYTDNNPTLGYSTSLNNALLYKWAPRSITTTEANTFCNNTLNKNQTVNFSAGISSENILRNEVGEYTFSLLDTTWTQVDSTVPSHHIGPYFTTAKDCLSNDDTVQSLTTSNFNGCNISSHYLQNGTIINNDINATFHPYSFKIDQNITTPNNGSDYVYMADINNTQDENTSLHIVTSISAIGQNNKILSNFVTGCFAKPIYVTIDKSATKNNALAYKYRTHNTDTNTSFTLQSIAAGDLTTDPTFKVTDSNFTKEQNGTTNLRTNLNFDRKVNHAVNPEYITFNTISAEDNTTSFYADANANKKAKGSVSPNKSIKYYYGQANAAGRQRFENTNGISHLYYQIYCFQNIDTNDCNTSTLPANTTRAGDIRWYINPLHNTSKDGNITGVTEKNANHVQAILLNNSTPTDISLTYDATQGFPYITTMDVNASPWLIWDKDNANAINNKFSVEFYKTSGWSGKHETNTTVENNATTITNRRTMW